jgi:glycosyltransferase involved in cell wall biosynthesis
MTNTKVSVIIPTYNRSYIVREAIDSVLSQTLSDIEVLVVDDGSTDDTEQVVEAFGDVRLKYIYKDNGGVSSARNLGISKAGGEYVAFLDSDDTWPSNFLEICSGVLDEKEDCGLSYTATTLKLPDGNIRRDNVERCVSGHVTTSLFLHSTIWPTTVLVRRSVMDGIWFDEQLKVSEDNDAFLRLSLKTQFVFIQDVIIDRRYSDDSLGVAAGIEGGHMRALSLERFYFRLGGDAVVARSKAIKKLSSCYKRAGKSHLKNDYRKASLYFLGLAIRYRPFDLRAYVVLLKALMRGASSDKKPNWQKPEVLGDVCCAVRN